MERRVNGVDIEKFKLQMENAYLKGRLKLERERNKPEDIYGGDKYV